MGKSFKQTLASGCKSFKEFFESKYKSTKQIFETRQPIDEFYKSDVTLYALVDFGDGKAIEKDKENPKRYVFCAKANCGKLQNLQDEKYSVVYKNPSESGVTFDEEKKSERSLQYIVDENGNMYAPVTITACENSELAEDPKVKVSCRKEDFDRSVVKNLLFATQNVALDKEEESDDKTSVVLKRADTIDKGDLTFFAGLEDSHRVTGKFLKRVESTMNLLNFFCLYMHGISFLKDPKKPQGPEGTCPELSSEGIAQLMKERKKPMTQDGNEVVASSMDKN